MKQKSQENKAKKINLFSLISLALIPVLVIVMVIPWYRLFILRDDLLSTLFIRIISMAIAGVLMVVFGLIGIFKKRKHKGVYKGNWMGVIGLIIGVVSIAISSFVVIDYLVTIA